MTTSSRKSLCAQVTIMMLALAISQSGCERRSTKGSQNIVSDPRRNAITALGRVTPGRAVVSVAGQTGSRILKLPVHDGQKVKAGDVLALLDAYPLREAERDAAQTALEETRSRLAAETDYAEAVIEQSRQAVRVLEIAVAHERREVERIKSLTSAAAVPGQKLIDEQFLLDSRESELGKANAELAAAQASLVRTQILVGLKAAAAQLKIAEAQLELTIVRAPIDGEILKVSTYPGERIGDEPILRMGDTADMHVIVEVYEADVGAVRVGQRASITSPALPEPVEGVVEEIGGLIYKNDVLDLDPRAAKDTRVVEVRVKVAKSEPISRFTNLEVSTRIDLDSAPPDSASR